MADVRVTLNNPLPSSGSSPIDRIEYRLDQDNATIATAPLTAPGNFDIVNGSDRLIELRQWNVTQASDWSDTKFASSIPVTVPPDQVTGLIATRGNAQNSLEWTAPTETGSSALTDYLIEVNVAGAGWTTITDGVSTATTYVHTGLTNGTIYQYRVSAINSTDTGAASAVATATPTSDTVAPVISGTSWVDGTKTITLTVSEACNLIVCTHAAAQTATADGSGGWTHTTLETFSEPVTGTGTIPLTITDETAERVSYYARDAAGNDSVALITETMTFATGAFIDTFDRASNEKLSASANWAIYNDVGLDVISSTEITENPGSNIAMDEYTGTVADNQYIEFVCAGGDSAHWIMMRSSDYANGLVIKLRAESKVEVYSRAAGVDTQIGSTMVFTPQTKETGDTFRFELNGQVLSVLKNGTDVPSNNEKDIGATITTGAIAIGIGGNFNAYSSVEIGDL